MKTDPYLDTNCEDSDKLIISKSRNSDLTKKKESNLFVSHIRRIVRLAETKLTWVCERFATGSRHRR